MGVFDLSYQREPGFFDYARALRAIERCVGHDALDLRHAAQNRNELSNRCCRDAAAKMGPDDRVADLDGTGASERAADFSDDDRLSR